MILNKIKGMFKGNKKESWAQRQVKQMARLRGRIILM